MICFHHDDPDGRCAGAIVNKKYAVDNARFIAMDYNKEPPIDLISEGEVVFIVDFSFKPEVMEEIARITPNITWIDHHRTILDHPWNNDKISGIREVGKSGALLTWEYLFDSPAPEAVRLVSDCDCCIFSDERSRPFVCGLQLYDHDPKAEIWKEELLDSNTIIPLLVQEGQTCLRFVERFGMDYGNKYGFEINFEGYRCFAQGLKWFGSRIDEYDICLFYAFLGDKWTVTLLSNNPSIDVSAIAKKYGGGGHKGAAGFECDELPFVKQPEEKA